MKNALPFLLLLLPFWAATQPKIVRQTTSYPAPTGWEPYDKVEYRYNHRGQETQRVNSRKNAQDMWEVTSLSVSQFDDADSLTQYKTYQIPNHPDSGGLYLLQQADYGYYPDGCLQSEFYRNFHVTGELYYSYRATYFNGANCRKDSVFGEFCDSVGFTFECTPSSYSVYEYSPNGNPTVQHRGEWIAQLGSFYREDSATVWRYDDDGKLLELVHKGSSRILYTYHPDGARATSESYLADSTGIWQLWSRDSVGYDYEYDNNDFVVRKKENYFYHFNSFSYSLDRHYYNFCDGLPRVEIINDQSRTTYEYSEAIDCDIERFFVEPEIGPNPASSLLYIHYPPMEKGKTIVRLFNAAGSEAVGYSVNYRAYDVEVDVSQLPIGMYFLQMLDGKRKFGQKVMVFR